MNARRYDNKCQEQCQEQLVQPFSNGYSESDIVLPVKSVGDTGSRRYRQYDKIDLHIKIAVCCDVRIERVKHIKC